MNQEDAILQHLQKGHSITPREALDHFGCMRLGARIWDLQRKGYRIASERIKSDTGKHYARYWMPEARRDRQEHFSFGCAKCLVM